MEWVSSLAPENDFAKFLLAAMVLVTLVVLRYGLRDIRQSFKNKPDEKDVNLYEVLSEAAANQVKRTEEQIAKLTEKIDDQEQRIEQLSIKVKDLEDNLRKSENTLMIAIGHIRKLYKYIDEHVVKPPPEEVPELPEELKHLREKK